MLEFRLFLNNVVLLCFILACWKIPKIGRGISALLLLLFTVNNGLAIMSFFLYKEAFNVALAYNILVTNKSEAIEALLTFKLAIFALVTYYIALFYLIHRVAKRQWKTSYLLLVAVVLLIYPIGFKSYNYYKKDKILTGESLGWMAKYNILTNTPLYNLASFYEANRFISELAKVKEQHMVYPHFTVEDTGLETIVVVLGESARKDVLDIYGGKHPTTPLLRKRMENLLIYDQAIAPSSFTNTALSFMLSKSIPMDKKDFKLATLNDNVIALANSTNVWDTYWLSNQDEVGIYENLYSVITKDAKHREHTKEKSYDEVILPMLTHVLQDANKKRLIFIHLKGSHMKVSERYPDAFDHFQVDERPLYNAYYNSILYTDYILDEIIKKVENQKSVVLYLSDHGQTQKKDKYIHGFTTKGLDVPFVIWHSNLVADTHKMTGRNEQPISTTNLYNIVSDLLGVKGLDEKDNNTELKALSPSFEVVTYEAIEQD
ncbi:phosphoethanolamine transferase [Myroides sp. WP-1]|uniref:phosphoethanolamine transferase n=1 Tax=Myroides sp. WP-1 TaxID=2759944 RepID=UPI0021084953|nr:phosphoethanolamine transferase [Myroides sp. WP-1]